MRTRRLLANGLVLAWALSACATWPRIERKFAGPPSGLSADPALQQDVERVLERIERARLRLVVVPERALPLATKWRRTAGLAVLPVVLTADTDPTRCVKKPGSHCTWADSFARRADGSEAPQAHLQPPRGQTDPMQALLWVLGLAVPALPAAALLTGEASAMAPPTPAPAPAELKAEYERLTAEEKAAGLYVGRTDGTRVSYGRVFQREPLADVAIEVGVRFGDAPSWCQVLLTVPKERFVDGASVELGRGDVCFVACPSGGSAALREACVKPAP